MFELIYMSTALSGMSTSTARNIAEQSQINNALSDISGVLVFNGTHFTQVLEGHESAVRRLFKIIASDDRHCDVKVLAQGPISGRSFSGWSMAYNDTGDARQLFERVVEVGTPDYCGNDVRLQRSLQVLKSTVLDSLRGK